MYLPKHPIDRFTDGVLESLDSAPSAVPTTKTPLEALEALVQLIEVQTTSERCQWIQAGPTFADAKAAIRKARGEQC